MSFVPERRGYLACAPAFFFSRCWVGDLCNYHLLLGVLVPPTSEQHNMDLPEENDANDLSGHTANANATNDDVYKV